MNRLQFSINIEAPKEKVWDALWNDSNYRNWTSVFSEGSHAVTDWNEGSKVLFLNENSDGMFSMIAKKIPNELMSFKHLGEVKNGKEEPPNEETSNWSDAMENYTLIETGGLTKLTVDLDGIEEYLDYFSITFPKALQKVKEISENNT